MHNTKGKRNEESLSGWYLMKLFTRYKRFVNLRNAPLLTAENGMDFLTITSGEFDPSKLTLFSIFRDEMYFCEAFFDHYRSIGIEQFLILDDGSTDGTLEFLKEQKDCVSLESELRFGQIIKFRSFGRRSGYSYARAGKKLKCVIPHLFLKDSFGIYVDADEFLLLPPGVEDLKEVIKRVLSAGELAVVAPMVDFFPERLPPGEHPVPPSSGSQIFRENPYFETTPLLDLRSDGTFVCLGHFKSSELCSRFDIKGVAKPRPSRKRRHAVGARHKVPILYHRSDAYRVGSHDVNVPVSPDVMLTLAHMVFTENLMSKVQRATTWKAHSNGASKYFKLKELIQVIRQEDASLIGPNSREFRSAADLIEAGLMRWR